MKVGLFAGTFDPIHLGHLNLAVHLQEECQLDKVLFCPSHLSPFKVDTPAKVSIQHRIEMVKLVIGQIPSFELLNWEIESDRPHYTIDTVRRLAKDPFLDIYLLMGDDHLRSFNQWKEADTLLDLATPLVATRYERGESPTLPDHRFQHVKIPIYEINSTDIRKRLSQKKYCGHLLPLSVLDYILTYQLYF